MNRVEQIFTTLRQERKRALMPFICGGHPRPGATAQALPALQAAGASIVEIGIPFSDPIADGPVIAAAMHVALQRGSTPQSVFDEVRSVRDQVSIGLVAMVSVSIVHRMGGPAEFVAKAADAGFDGFIFPDAPLEESGVLLSTCRERGVSASLLISPSTPFTRAKEIVAASSGFVYLLARAGITGERSEAPEVGGRVNKLREVTELPIAVGFGISNAGHVLSVTETADAAIVGSALVRRMSEADEQGRDPVAEASNFVRELCQGLQQRQPSAGQPAASGA